MDDIKPKIREFLARFIRNHEMQDGEDIFATGYVNSMFAMQLVQFVEQEFAITCESEDLELDNFRSVDALDAFIRRKQGAPVG